MPALFLQELVEDMHLAALHNFSGNDAARYPEM
jgi:hypothetical protein